MNILHRIIAIATIGILLVLFAITSNTFLQPLSINEIAQDYLSDKIGLNQIHLNNVDNLVKREQELNYAVFYDKDHTILSIESPYAPWREIAPAFRLSYIEHVDGLKNSKNFGLWGENLFVEFKDRNRLEILSQRLLNGMVFIAVLWAVSLLLQCTYGLYYPQATGKKTIILIQIALVMWGGWLLFQFPQKVDYNEYIDDYRILQKHSVQLNEVLLQKAPLKGINFLPNWHVGFMASMRYWPWGRQDNDIVSGKAFFASQHSGCPVSYIRYSINLFAFLFYAPDANHKSIQKINCDLIFIPLGDGFWLGYYEQEIKILCSRWKLSLLSIFILLLNLLFWCFWVNRRGCVKRGKDKKESFMRKKHSNKELL